MKSEWKEYKISEFADVIGGGTPSTKIEEYYNGTIPWLTPRDMSTHSSKYICEGARSITSLGLKKSSARLVPKGTVLFTSRAPIGYIAIAKQEVSTNQGFKSLICNDKIAHNEYIYYLLKSKVFAIESIASGSTFKEVSGSVLKDFILQLPSIPTQKRIAHILSALDDKIELNRKMNQTLEAMAQTLFKSWFVDFDPVKAKAKCKNDEELESAALELGISKEVLELFPSEFEESELGIIPKGWMLSTIDDEVVIYGGTTPSTKESKYWDSGIHNWATPRDLSGLDSKILLNTSRKITDLGVKKISSKQLPIGTILLSSRAPVGYIAYSSTPISINQGFIAMVCNKKISNYFILYWLDIAMSEIKNRAGGTTFSEISKTAFRPIKLVVPSSPVLSSFDFLISPFVSNMIKNEQETQTLQKTRDTLLPKLLSGELDVSDLDIENEG